MAKGILGVDTNAPLTEARLIHATNELGQTPKFWGRYFKTPAQASDVQYSHQEAAIFRAHDIRMVPFARQTGNVGGTLARGKTDGANNAAAFLAEISVAQLLKSSDHFYFFLDTEPRPGPALTIQYYSGWSQALIAKGLELSNGKITFKPGVYLNHGDDETCRNLTSAIQSSHAECAGLVVARYLKQSTLKAPEWKDATVNPNIQVPRPSLMWQYVGDLGPSQVFDGLEMNPNFNDVFSHLAIP